MNRVSIANNPMRNDEAEYLPERCICRSAQRRQAGVNIIRTGERYEPFAKNRIVES